MLSYKCNNLVIPRFSQMYFCIVNRASGQRLKKRVSIPARIHEVESPVSVLNSRKRLLGFEAARVLSKLQVSRSEAILKFAKRVSSSIAGYSLG